MVCDYSVNVTMVIPPREPTVTVMKVDLYFYNRNIRTLAHN